MDLTILPTPIKSKSDLKEYRHLKLSNGLRVLLISDVHVSRSEWSSVNKHDDNASSNESSIIGDGEDESIIDDYDSDEVLEDDDENDLSDVNSTDMPQKAPNVKKQAAAALCVGVGSYFDPTEIPGLAHFLEHMVFMGSSLYPDENHFEKFIKRHGGDDNAFTDCERTVFKFEINPCYLKEALNIWAQFFISPLMKKNSISREIKAVDSEFRMALVDDHVRGEQLLGLFCKNGHPIGKFLWGNEKTLKKYPAKKGIDVYSALQNFHKKFYNAISMSLAVQSTEGLDTLQDWIVNIFGQIPNNSESIDIVFPPNVPYPIDDQFVFKICHIVPVEKLQQLQIRWFLPPQQKYYQTKPLHYITWLIGHEGKGTLLSLLKKKHLALSILAETEDSGFSDSSMYSILNIEINLTDKGRNEYLTVVDYLFQYLYVIRKDGPNKQIYNEIQQIENIDFTYCEEEPPLDYVEDLCENMQCYAPADVLTGDYLLIKYNEAIIENVLNALMPQTCLIFLYDYKLQFNEEVKKQKEPWFGTTYAAVELDDKWSMKWKNWSNCDVHPDFYFPSPNLYIANDFTLVDVTVQPQLSENVTLLATKYTACSLWFKQDAKFRLPKAFIRLHLINSISTVSPEHSAYLDLLILVLIHEMAEDVYPADVASLTYGLSSSSKGGLIVKVSGFNDKLMVLLVTILTHLIKLTCSQQVFDEQLTELRKRYHNNLISPSKLCKNLRLSILEKLRFPLFEIYSASSNLTLNCFLSFISHFKSTFHVDCLIQGNYSEKEAVSIFEKSMEVLQCTFLDASDVLAERTLQLPTRETYLKVQSFNSEDENSMITFYIQYGCGLVYDSCLMQLLSTCMEEPCFNILRTQKQLGYIVYVVDHNTSGILGLSVNVRTQVSKFSVEEVTEEMKNFLTHDFSNFLNEMTDQDFQDQVNSLIVLKTNEDSQLSEDVDRNWDEIVFGDRNFNRLEQEVNCLKDITFNQFKDFYKKICYIIKSVLVVQVQGSFSKPPADIPVAYNSLPFHCDVAILPPEDTLNEGSHITNLGAYIKSSFYHPVSHILVDP